MKHIKLIPLATLTCFTVTAGCVDADDAEDGEGDSFLTDGKSDAHGIADDSLEASGILTMLQSATFQNLDVAAKLSSRAAREIVKHRQGRDALDGTADDNQIDTLAELDAVPYVGAAVFQSLLEHAEASRWMTKSTDPFDPRFCVGDRPLSSGTFLGWFSRGALSATVPLGEGRLLMRTRNCNATTGCTNWSYTSDGSGFEAQRSGGFTYQPKVQISTYQPLRAATVEVSADGSYASFTLEANLQYVLGMNTSCRLAAATGDAPLYPSDCAQTNQEGDRLMFVGDQNYPEQLHVGEHCARFFYRRTAGTTSTWTERELAYVARY
jgi:hypothetical protein